jgi:hypothetical protein
MQSAILRSGRLNVLLQVTYTYQDEKEILEQIFLLNKIYMFPLLLNI